MPYSPSLDVDMDPFRRLATYCLNPVSTVTTPTCLEALREVSGGGLRGDTTRRASNGDSTGDSGRARSPLDQAEDDRGLLLL